MSRWGSTSCTGLDQSLLRKDWGHVCRLLPNRLCVHTCMTTHSTYILQFRWGSQGRKTMCTEFMMRTPQCMLHVPSAQLHSHDDHHHLSKEQLAHGVHWLPLVQIPHQVSYHDSCVCVCVDHAMIHACADKQLQLARPTV